jgi:hypothetical protein
VAGGGGVRGERHKPWEGAHLRDRAGPSLRAVCWPAAAEPARSPTVCDALPLIRMSRTIDRQYRKVAPKPWTRGTTVP